MTDHHQHPALASLENLIGEPEGERPEFKEARGGFHFERLAKYCAALSNEDGGSIRAAVAGCAGTFATARAGLVKRSCWRIDGA